MCQSLTWASNLNFSKSLVKGVAKLCDQDLLHATFLKVVLPLSEEFEYNLPTETYYEYR